MLFRSALKGFLMNQPLGDRLMKYLVNQFWNDVLKMYMNQDRGDSLSEHLMNQPLLDWLNVYMRNHYLEVEHEMTLVVEEVAVLLLVSVLCLQKS